MNKKTFTAHHPDVIMARDLYARFNNKSEVAREMGLNRSKVGRLLGVSDNSPPASAQADLPTFADEDIPAEDILDHMGKRFDQRIDHEKSIEWFKIRLPTDEPIGLCAVGDPHLGANSCNIPLLRSDIEIMASTPGVYAMNMGDTADNWGRLIHLYAENDVSRQTERRLARWFLQDAGVPWLLWVLGNHDTMHGEFSTYLKTINASTIPMVEWRARFKLAFPCGQEIKVDAAHNHKGTSIYNKLHGQIRAALWGQDADIYVAGHHHDCAIMQVELDDGRWVNIARARGYKWLDDWATKGGFRNNLYGATVMFVIDPKEEDPSARVHTYANLRKGAEFLTYLRSR